MVLYRLTFIALFITKVLLAQQPLLFVDQDAKLDSLIKYKIISNKKTKKDTFYQIQIYSGSKKGADVILQDFKKKFKNWYIEIIFETPNYKVRVGKFSTRLEVDKKLLEVKQFFTNAFLY